MPNCNPFIILGGKKLWGTFWTVDYYTGQTAVNLTFWPKQEEKENKSDEKIVKQFTEVWRSNSTGLDDFHRKYNLHFLEYQFWKRVYQDWDESQESRWKKMSVVAIICEHYKGTWWRMAFLINVASSIVTNIALVGPWFERPRLRERGTLDGRGGGVF